MVDILHCSHVHMIYSPFTTPSNSYVELELSAQDQAADPPETL